VGSTPTVTVVDDDGLIVPLAGLVTTLALLELSWYVRLALFVLVFVMRKAVVLAVMWMEVGLTE